MKTDCLIAYGSNLGDSDRWFAQICSDWKADQRISALKASSLITTAPIGTGNSEKQNPYRNGCIRFTFAECQDALFKLLRDTELKFGRQRRERWGSRTVDLDLLLFGSQKHDSNDLKVPHPRMTFRRFVLEPAAEIASEMTHPWSSWSIEQHLDCLDTRPDSVVIVFPQKADTDDEQVALQKQLTEFEKLGWQILFRSDGDLPVPKTTKLLVFTGQLSSELLDSARKFPGATLNSSSETGQFNIGEVAAAIEAMRPLSKT